MRDVKRLMEEGYRLSEEILKEFYTMIGVELIEPISHSVYPVIESGLWDYMACCALEASPIIFQGPHFVPEAIQGRCLHRSESILSQPDCVLQSDVSNSETDLF